MQKILDINIKNQLLFPLAHTCEFHKMQVFGSKKPSLHVVSELSPSVRMYIVYHPHTPVKTKTKQK